MVRSSLPLTSPLITMLFPILTVSCFMARCSPPRVSPIPPVASNGSVAALAALDGDRGVSSRFHIGVTSIAPTVPSGPTDLPLLARRVAGAGSIEVCAADDQARLPELQT